MKCYLCGSSESKRRFGRVRDDKSIGIWECEACGLVFLDAHKTNEQFYIEGNMHDERVAAMTGGGGG
ncbi:hypothetical protein, partial [Helicobacter jaachi]|uniref:hypothetical protein n=1 Tax=Helicobacter jaachi TaxID=1677920 RepID=UPI000512EBBA